MALGANANLVDIIIRARDQTKAAFASAKTGIASTKGATGKLKTSLGGLNGGFSKLSSSLGSFGAALGPIGIAVVAAGVVMATLGGAAIKAALEFEKAVATIRVGTGATGEALVGLEASFKTVFTAVPASTANAATAIADLNTRLGLTGEPLEALATQFLNLSRITGTEVAGSISSATRVMHDFDVSTEEQAGALDYLFKVSQSTGLGMTQLGNSMTQYGSVMRQMGFDINESAALLGKFEKEGVNLQLVLGSLRMGLANFAKAGEEPVEALSRVITEIQGMGSVAGANLKAIEIFGSRAGPDMAAAIREGRFSIEELMATLDASTETINKAAADTLQFGDKWTLFKNKIMGAIAPIGDIITNVLGNAIEGLSKAFDSLQKIAGPAIDILFLKFKMLQAFLEGLFAPIIQALAPLKNSFDSIGGSVSKLDIVFKVISDIVIILTGAAKMLGTAIGNLVAMALTPLVAKLQEGIQTLTGFYDKLGPVKDLIEGVKGVAGGVVEGISNMSESFRETVPPIEEVEEALDALNDVEPEAPQAIADAWALAITDFQDGVGTYKDAIGGIEEKITDLTEEWMTSTDKRRDAIDREMDVLEAEKDTLEDLKKTTEDHFSTAIEQTEKAKEKMEEFKVTIGDTTIEFKGAAAEVVKNAAAYEKLQDSAQKLMDLDWSVFTEFEAALPNIEEGIGDMESAFVGLKDILGANIGSLENVKESVMGISEIAAPFLEAGFLDGIKSIGAFADALSDAGGAINTFANLQEVSIEGCSNFSLHVHDMVSALQILDSQMEDLVPSFKKMDSMIDSIKIGFLAGIDITMIYGAEWSHLQDILRGVSADWEYTYKALAAQYDLTAEDIKILREEGDLATFAFMRQTSGLKKQTVQLKKITDALEPYLEFMRTLNELAALSTLSTEELNAGLNSINDTLVNLGSALSTFDLRPVMESLFGTTITEGDLVGFTGGTAKGFTDIMVAYQGEFSMLISYVSQLSSAILTLTSAFDALANISESVLADQTKLKEVFEDLTDIMANFKLAMGAEEGEWDFAQKIADGLDAMIESAKPLITYFQGNNTEVKLFNDTLNIFSATITNVVDTMGMMKEMSELVIPSVDELGAGFDKAKEFVDNFDEALMQHIGLARGDKAYTYDAEGGLTQGYENNVYTLEKMFDNLFTSIMRSADDWAHIDKEMGDSFKAFADGTKTITDMISTISALTEAFRTLADMPLITSDQIVASFEKLKDAINEINEGMKAFAAEGLSDLITYLKSVADMWTDWDTKLGESDDTFGKAVIGITALVTAITDLVDVQKRLAELEVVSDTEWESFFYKLTEHIYNFYEGMAKFGEVGIAALAYNLKGIEKVWQSWIEALGKDSLTSFSDASSGIGGLIDSITSLVGAFVSLAEMPIMTADAFSAGMKDMVTNITNFASALKDNIDTIEESLKKMDDAWSDNADEMERLLPIFKAATNALNTLAGGIMSTVRSFESLKEVKFEEVFATGFENLTKATGAFATSLKNNIDGLLTSLNALVTGWLANEDETVRLMRAFITISSNFIIVIGFANALQDAFNSMSAKTGTLGRGFKELTEFMNGVILGVQKIYTTDAASDLARFVIDVGLVVDALSTLEGKIDSAMDTIKEKTDATVNSMKAKISELGDMGEDVYRWGADLIVSFVDGMRSMEFYLEGELLYIADLIAFYLGVGSNTKLGALSHLTEWPENLVKTFAAGIRKGTPEISQALSALTLPTENLHMPGGYAGMLGGGGNTVTMYNTWNVDSQQDADYAIGEIETMLTRRRVL